ncbi:linoleate 9S-lipoxygenase-like, partial [Trifolium medium]|nr:linoleate 9S-lipoxygenase-like [Trifolium medium]
MSSLETDIINNGKKLIKGTVVLKQKNLNVVGDSVAPSILDTSSVALKLISASKSDGSGKGKVGKQTFLEGKTSPFNIEFEWNHHSMGNPGAFYIENFMQQEFFL